MKKLINLLFLAPVHLILFVISTCITIFLYGCTPTKDSQSSLYSSDREPWVKLYDVMQGDTLSYVYGQYVVSKGFAPYPIMTFVQSLSETYIVINHPYVNIEPTLKIVPLPGSEFGQLDAISKSVDVRLIINEPTQWKDYVGRIIELDEYTHKIELLLMDDFMLHVNDAEYVELVVGSEHTALGVVEFKFDVSNYNQVQEIEKINDFRDD